MKARSRGDAIDATAVSLPRRDGPDAVRNSSKSTKKPPTTSCDGHESIQGSEGASTRQNTEKHLGLDLARIAGEQRQEALGPRVDDVDLMQRYGMDDLLALLELACAEHRRGPKQLEFEK